MILKKLNFGNDNYYLSYCLAPVANIKVIQSMTWKGAGLQLGSSLLNPTYTFCIRKDEANVKNLNLCDLFNLTADEMKNEIFKFFEDTDSLIILFKNGPCFMNKEDLFKFYEAYENNFSDEILLQTLILDKLMEVK